MISMEIEINDTRNIDEIQRDFNTVFPFLKIVFFNALNGKILSQEKYFRNGLVKIGEYRTKTSEKKIVISTEHTVAELEKLFIEEYNLIAQVLRNSGKVWLETVATRD